MNFEELLTRRNGSIGAHFCNGRWIAYSQFLCSMHRGIAPGYVELALRTPLEQKLMDQGRYPDYNNEVYEKTKPLLKTLGYRYKSIKD